MKKDNLAIALQFIETLQSAKTENLFQFYDAGIVQTEYPNHITPVTAVRNLDELEAARLKGKKIIQQEKYEVLHSYCSGDNVIIEAKWTGTLAVPVGTLPAGGEIKAFFAAIL